MPELPEVETTRQGILPHIIQQEIAAVIIRQPRLRWPVPPHLPTTLAGQTLRHLSRRGKYLLFGFDKGTLILHLGMSGRLRVLSSDITPEKHDHIDIYFANKTYLRFTDPRRFGAVLFTDDDIQKHPLLSAMGPEPLTAAFNSTYLMKQAQGKKTPVKSFIMNSHVVSGVGNIYATEALFKAHINPKTPAGKLTLSHYQQLTIAIKTILKKAIKKGGTTLKDFLNPSGSPGYFSIELQVYGQSGKPCPCCGATLKSMQIANRSTVYCKQCQR